jgi:hypothetical protein
VSGGTIISDLALLAFFFFIVAIIVAFITFVVMGAWYNAISYLWSRVQQFMSAFEGEVERKGWFPGLVRWLVAAS